MDGYLFDGQALRRTRESKRKRQSDVARAAGVSRQYLCAVENGHFQPSNIWILQIADALGVQFTEFCSPLDDADDVDQAIPA